MLSDLISILQKVDLEEVTDLDDKCIRILFYLLVNSEKTFNHNQLNRKLNDFGFYIPEPTFSRHLDHLEEKEYIIRDRGNRTDISLNVTSIESKTKLMNAVDLTFKLFEQYKEDEASDLENDELFRILKQYCMEKVSCQFLLKLKLINKSVPENEFQGSYLWCTMLYDFLIESYLDIVRERGDQTIIELLDMYYKDGQ